MKKILCLFCLIFCLFGLSGCESSRKEKLKIVNILKSEKVISDSMELFDTMSYRIWSMESCNRKNYYIYKDKNSKMIAILYVKMSSDENKSEHKVTIYYDVDVNKDVNILKSDEVTCNEEYPYYVYLNGDYTSDSRYDLNNEKTYVITMKKEWFKDKYVVKEFGIN